jgi:cell division septal protein FtsQ
MSDPGRFPVERVIVQGALDGVHREVELALSPMLGRNIFTADLEEAGRLARAHRWVGSARVRRRLPSALLVTLDLRSVEALVHEGSGIRMLAADGADLGPFDPTLAGVEHPVITGVAAATREETETRLRRGLKAVHRLRREAALFTAALSTLDVSRPDRLVGTLRDYWSPVYLSSEDPVLNLDHLPSVRARLESEDLRAAYIDLRFKNRIAVRLDGKERIRLGA